MLKEKILPKTKLGWWSVGLIIAMPILFVLGQQLNFNPEGPAGNSILEDITLRPFLVLSILTGLASGVAAFITGIIAIAKQKERAILTFISTIFGALLILVLIAEFTFME